MATNIDISKFGIGAVPYSTFATGDQKLTVGGNSVTVNLKTATDTLTFAGYGKFTIDQGKITFKAAADFAGGEYEFTNVTNGDVTVADFSSVTTGVTATATDKLLEIIGGTGADSIKGDAVAAKLTGGAGNDTIATNGAADTINAGAGDDYVSVNTAATHVTLGAGADTLKTNDVAAVITDYNYAQGDKIELATTFTAAAGLKLSSGGKLGTTAGLDVTTAAENGVYKVAISDSDATKREYWTAGSGAAAVMDASSYTNAVVMDATAADSASISLGYGDDTVSLSAKANTVKIGKASGTDTFVTEKFGSDDTLVLTGGGTLSDFVLSTLTAGDATYAGTTLAGALETDQGQLKISTDNGATSKMVMYASTDAQILKASTDVDVYIGKKDSDAVIESATDVNFYDTDKYKNITSKIVVTGSGAFIGAKDKKTSIDASAATDAVQIWGGSTDANDIKLNATGKKSDTVWFGTTDGADSVTAGFVGGYGTDGDVLYLYDTADLNKVSFATEKITTGKSTVSIAGASDQINIKLSNGTVKKVAADLIATGGADRIDAEYADVVIGDAKTAKTVVYGATQTDAVTVNLYDTDKYQNITSVDTKAATGGATILGVAGLKSTISTGVGTNAIWGGSTAANTISLLTNDGTDTVWFGAADGADEITGFQAAQDTVKLWDASSAKDVFKNYSVDTFVSGTNISLKSAANTDSTLNVKGSLADGGVLKIVDTNNKSANMAVTAVVATKLTFATDTSIYYSTVAGATVSVSGSVTGTVAAFLDNGGWADAGDYYFSKNVTTFDASASAASTVLFGRAESASTLKGGLTENNIWGGGYASQDMQGSVSAVDTIWFGSKDGQDTFSFGVDKDDTIYLWDVTSIGDAKITNISGTAETLVIGGSQLTIKDDSNTALDGGLSFKLSTGESYTYDKANTKFVAKV